MTVIGRVTSPAGWSPITKLSLAGAICYALWGCLHLQAAYAVYRVGASLEPGMAQGRVFQDAWNLLFFGVTAIVIALTLNIRNNAWGYWINLGVLTLADTGRFFSYWSPDTCRSGPALQARCCGYSAGSLRRLLISGGFHHSDYLGHEID